MSHVQLPTLADLGLAIYISAPAKTVTISAKKPKSSKPKIDVVTKHTRKQKNVCKTEGCSQRRQLRGFCRRHGGVRACTVAGCFTNEKGGGLCQAHGGGTRCSIEGCNKGVQRYTLCYGHGGSRLCGVPECTRSDRGTGFCMKHQSARNARGSSAAYSIIK